MLSEVTFPDKRLKSPGACKRSGIISPNPFLPAPAPTSLSFGSDLGERGIMAKFVGTVQEFHHFIGPKVRNAVNLAARGHRNRLVGICEGCSEKAELQSAHVHGRDRRTLIETVLAGYTDEAGNGRV